MCCYHCCVTLKNSLAKVLVSMPIYLLIESKMLHYDDIEAFLIQLEGEKHWKIYRPLENKQYLDRFSSKNFTQEEVEGFECFEILLKPGDMLYVPKGVIHQAVTSNDEHSLHITVSTSHLMS